MTTRKRGGRTLDIIDRTLGAVAMTTRKRGGRTLGTPKALNTIWKPALTRGKIIP